MSLNFPAGQHYDCVQCGRSCQAGWDIPVEEAVRQRIDGHFLTLRVIQERGSAYLEKKSGPVLNMTPTNPRCGFLEDDMLCGLHKHLGVEAKPNTCRLFPYILSETPDGVFVGVSYSCTGARQNAGRALSEHAADIRELLDLGTTTNVIHDDGLVVHGSWFVTWREYLRFESALLALASSVGLRLAISQFLLGLARQVSLWSRPRSPGPKPAPAELVTGGSLDQELLGSLRAEMWSQVSAQLSLVRPLEPVPLLPEVERYLEHLIFRKQLVMHPTLLSNLCLLDFLPTFLGVHAAGLARDRGRDLSEQDYWDALDLAEKFLVYHCRGLRPVYQRCARFLIENIQARRPI